MSDDVPLERMIRQQIVERGLTDARLLEALRSVPREPFFPDEGRADAHADRASPLGHGQTISQPYVVALMTDRLDVQPHHRVLEIGTGSGYQTAVLSRLAGEVFTVERIKPLLDAAFDRLAGLGVRNVRYRFGDGFQGWPEHAPYDRLLIAAAPPTLPRELLASSLVDGGVAVLPVGGGEGQELVRVVRQGDGLRSETLCAVRFVPMVGEVASGE